MAASDCADTKPKPLRLTTPAATSPTQTEPGAAPPLSILIQLERQPKGFRIGRCVGRACLDHAVKSFCPEGRIKDDLAADLRRSDAGAAVRAGAVHDHRQLAGVEADPVTGEGAAGPSRG